MKQRQVGFTLIEMIVTISVLGLIAVTVAPKFISFQQDARVGVLTASASAAASAANIVYAKAVLENKETLASDDANAAIKTASGDEVKLAFGYPSAAADGIVAAVTGFDTDFEVVNATRAAGEIQLTLKSLAAEGKATCYFTYKEPEAAGKAPTTTVTCAAESTGGSDKP
ncbi:MAG: pilus assembly FimT family protein, partial [Enterovibrio sp.]